MAKKNDNNILPIIALGAGVFLLSGSKTKNRNVTNNTTTNNVTNNTTTTNLEQYENVQFPDANGVSSPISSDIIPFIVQDSFTIQENNNFYYTELTSGKKIYKPIAECSFLFCMHVPATSLGSMSIEEMYLDYLKLVQYISDEKQKWVNVSGEQLKLRNELNKAFKNQIIHTGFNLFRISFYYIPGIYNNAVYESYEAVSFAFEVKFAETQRAAWTCLSAWNIKESSFSNDGDILTSYTPFGVTRNYRSKQNIYDRGNFSKWWDEYLQAGGNTHITEIDLRKNVSYDLGADGSINNL